MNILVLGGTGAMGMHLVGYLGAGGHRVVVTSRHPRPGCENIEYVCGNAHERPFLDGMLARERWDAIVDFMVYGTEEFRTRHEALLSATGQYVFLSSSRVYAASEEPLKEESPRLLDVSTDTAYLAREEYALMKARQENILMSSPRRNWTIIRPYITYAENRLQLGVLEKEEWLWRALRGRNIVFSRDIAERTTTLTYGRDVALAMAVLVGRTEALGEAFHITCGESIRWSEVLDLYCDVLERRTGRRPRVVLTDRCMNLDFPSACYQVKYDRLFDRRFSNAKISRFVDPARFVSPREGLRRCLEAFCDHPVFGRIGCVGEGFRDKVAGEHATPGDFPTWKARAGYALARYATGLAKAIIRSKK